jgi:hypothetical protein
MRLVNLRSPNEFESKEGSFMPRFVKDTLTTISLTAVALAAITGHRAQSADTDLRPAIQAMRDEIRELRRDVQALRELLETREDRTEDTLPHLPGVHIESYLESNIALGAQASVSKMTGNEIIASIDGRPVLAYEIFHRAFPTALTPDGTSLLTATKALAAGQISEQDFRELQVFAIRKFAKDHIRTRALSEAMIASLGKTQKAKTEDAIAKEFDNYVEKLKKDFNVSTVFDVDKRLRKQGTTLLSLKEEFRDRLLADAYLRGHATRADEPASKRPKSQVIAPELDRRVTLDCDNRPLSEVLEQIFRDRPKIEFHYEQPFGTVDHPAAEHSEARSAQKSGAGTIHDRENVTLHVADVPVSVALQRVFEQLHLRYQIQNGVLRIEIPADEKLREALQRRVSFDCDKIPLQEFLLRASQDWHLKVAMPNKLTSRPRITLHVSGATIESVLKLGFEQSGVRYKFAEDVLVLSPAEPQVILVYPVADLLTNVEPQSGIVRDAKIDFNSLETLIRTAVEPNTWEQLGGKGHIAHSEETLSLVIRQTGPVHDQIRNLLQKLRQPQQFKFTFRTTLFQQHAAELISAAGIDPPAEQGMPTLIARDRCDFLMALARDAAGLAPDATVSADIGKEMLMHPVQGEHVWPESIQVLSGQLGGRAYVWFELTGTDPTTGQPHREGVISLSPDFKPVLIPLRTAPAQESQERPPAPAVDRAKVDERRFLLIRPLVENTEPSKDQTESR